MTNRIAFVLLGLVIAFFVIDHFWLHLGAALVLARRLLDAIEYLAFWR